MKLSAIISKEDDMYVALAPDVDIASQGKTIEEALDNLREAVELYFEDDDAVVPITNIERLITFIEVGN